MKRAAGLFIFLFSPFSLALPLRGTISSSLGGAGVAGITAAEGALLNPASVAIFPGMGIDGTYRDGSPRDGEHQQVWAVGAIDNSKESLFSGAFHYARLREVGRTNSVAKGELYHGAFGYRFTELLALGFSVYRLTETVAAAPVRTTTQWNGDLGALVMVSPSVGFGYALQNLALPGDDVPYALRQSLRHTLGFYAGVGEFIRFRADVGRRERDNPRGLFTFATGVETRMRNFFLFRIGFRHDEAGDGRLATAGLSLDGPRLKVDYALVKDVSGASGALHSVDLRIPF